MNLETNFQLPNRGGHHGIDGQGRVLGFLGVIFPGRVTFIHLDYPGVTIEAEIPHTYGYTAGGQVGDPCFFALSTDMMYVSRSTRGTFPCQPKT